MRVESGANAVRTTPAPKPQAQRTEKPVTHVQTESRPSPARDKTVGSRVDVKA